MTTTYAVLDLETTGSTYDNGDRIIQIGVAFVQNGQVVDQFATDIFPNQEIPREITKLTGITNEQVKHAPKFQEVAEILWQKLSNTVIVAHNIGFDYKFLDKTFQAHGYPPMAHDRIDTVEMVRTLYPTADSYKLGEFCMAHGIQLENAHTAIDDAVATAQILIMCQAKVATMPAELFTQIQPFLHYFIGQTGDYMAQWFKSSKAQSRPYEYIAPFVLSPKLANFQLFPSGFGEKEASYLQAGDLKVVKANHGVALAPLQQTMVKEVAPFFQHRPEEVAEKNRPKYAFLTANAGVGKSLAYLISALTAIDQDEKKTSQKVEQADNLAQVVISTSTVILQHQFLDKTVQLAANLLGKPLKTVILKGQNHFIQLTKLHKYIQQLKQHPEAALKRDVLISVALFVWLHETETGDLHELNSGLNNEVYWQNVNRLSKGSRNDEIQRWGDYAFYERHVTVAKSANIVILNHAYFVYHYTDLISQGVLSDQAKVIIDECHQLPVTVHQQEIKSLQSKEVEETLTAMERTVHRLMDKVVTNNVKIHAVDKLYYVENNLQEAWENLDRFIDQISDQYQTKSYYQRHTAQKSYYIAHDYYMVANWRDSIQKAVTAMAKMLSPLKGIAKQLQQMDILTKRAYQQMLGQLNQFGYHIETWIEASKTSKDYYADLQVHFGKHQVQVTVDKKLYSSQSQLAAIFQAIPSPMLLVSASLEIVHAKNRIQSLFGIEDFAWYTFMEDSYTQQLITGRDQQVRGYYLKDFLSIDKYNEDQAAEVIADLIETLWNNKQDMKKIQVFFQSRSLMRTTQFELKQRMTRSDYGHLIMQNNQRNLDRIARQYEESARAILFALASFQEGVHLNAITDAFVLTRLPFSAPDTPDELAKQDYLKSLGDNYFDDVALPDMLMNLTQIFGRMASSGSQQAIFVSLDKRLEKAAYADQIADVMPDALMMRTIKLQDLRRED
ncbi:exonuclease domain-containing protein [Aerococcaceae bacterium 50-4]